MDPKDRPSLAPSEFSVEDDVDAAVDMQDAELQWARIHAGRSQQLERFEKSVLSEVANDEEADGIAEAFHEIRRRLKGSGRLPPLVELHRLYGISRPRVKSIASSLLKHATSRRHDPNNRDSVATVRTNLTGSSDNNDYEDDFENELEDEEHAPAARRSSRTSQGRGKEAKRSTSPEQVVREVSEGSKPYRRGSVDRNGSGSASSGVRRSGKQSTMWIHANLWRLGEKIGSGSFGVSSSDLY